MLEQAEADGHKAKRMFGYAVKAEEVHAKLYQMALEAVKQGKDLNETEFYLCPVCGHIELGAPAGDLSDLRCQGGEVRPGVRLVPVTERFGASGIGPWSRVQGVSDAEPSMNAWECGVCGYVYDEAQEGTPWDELPDDWECPICGAARAQFEPGDPRPSLRLPPRLPHWIPRRSTAHLREWARAADELETHMADIHRMAETGGSIIEPMRSAAASGLLGRHPDQGRAARHASR